MAQTILNSRRLRMRCWRRSDSHDYNAFCNTPEVMAWLGGVVTPTQLRAELEWHIRQQTRNGISFWVVERKRDGKFMGFCGLIEVRETASPICGQLEIGWRIRADMWRRGYAFEAATAALEWATKHYAERTVYARINPQNTASASLARKLGMKRRTGMDHTHAADGMQLSVYAFTRPSQ